MEIPTVPPIVLYYKLGDECDGLPKKSVKYLRKPNVPVDVAMSLIGMAACRAMRGVWKEMNDFKRAGLSPYLEQTANTNASNQGIKLLLRPSPKKFSWIDKGKSIPYVLD